MTHRAVLIGIDDYLDSPLRGCVNDIDAIEILLLDRLGLPPERVVRLDAPLLGAPVSTRLVSKAPTLDHLLETFSDLARTAENSDCILVYYSGHGAQVPLRAKDFRGVHEALVPWDYREPSGGYRLLYDFEINNLLSRIASRAADLTLVLDCCHSASAIRALDGDEEGVRYLSIPEVQDLPEGVDPTAAERSTTSLAGGENGYLAVTACGALEKAREVTDPVSGLRHGALTHTWLDLLSCLEDSRLPEIRWAEIWPALVDRVSRLNPLQHPRLLGRPERRIFGGPWQRRDPGYILRQSNHNVEIAAGTLAGLTQGAEVAVYGEHPDLFPPLGSSEDLAARHGLLRVVSAERARCTAVAVRDSFPLPAAARGRLVKPGLPDRLVVALKPFDPELASRLERGGFFRVLSSESPEAEVLVSWQEGGDLFLGDELHGHGRDLGGHPLARIPANDYRALESALSHYARYNSALRLGRRATNLTGALQVCLLDCNDNGRLWKAHPQSPDLPEVAFGGNCRYAFSEGDRFCIVVENRRPSSIYVTLLNCTSSGRVEYLGDEDLPPWGMHAFWANDILGSPFTAGVGVDAPLAIDRLIVVGTTEAGMDLHHLEVRQSFAEVLRPPTDQEATYKDALTMPSKPAAQPRESWIAQMVTLKIRRL